MLLQKNRLRKEKEFKEAFKKGRSFFTPVLGFKVAKNHLKETRVGIIVGTKISKKAVKRNRLKRQLREIFRVRLDPEVTPLSLKKTKKIKGDYDIVVITRPGILDKNFEELSKIVDGLLLRARLF